MCIFVSVILAFCPDDVNDTFKVGKSLSFSLCCFKKITHTHKIKQIHLLCIFFVCLRFCCFFSSSLYVVSLWIFLFTSSTFFYRNFLFYDCRWETRGKNWNEINILFLVFMLLSYLDAGKFCMHVWVWICTAYVCIVYTTLMTEC